MRPTEKLRDVDQFVPYYRREAGGKGEKVICLWAWLSSLGEKTLPKNTISAVARGKRTTCGIIFRRRGKKRGNFHGYHQEGGGGGEKGYWMQSKGHSFVKKKHVTNLNEVIRKGKGGQHFVRYIRIVLSQANRKGRMATLAMCLRLHVEGKKEKGSKTI